MQLGDIVTFKVDDQILTGTIVSLYAMQKNPDLMDINVDGITYFGISTDQIIMDERNGI